MGAVAGPASMNVFEYVVYRRLALGLRPRRMGRREQGVVPAGNRTRRTSAQLAYLPDEPYPVEGRDRRRRAARTPAGNRSTRRRRAATRCTTCAALFATKDPDEIVLSGPSAERRASVGVSDKNLMVLGPGDDEKPEDATEARLLLKNTGLHESSAASHRPRRAGRAVTLGNAAGASIVLHADGSIELAPAAGQARRGRRRPRDRADHLPPRGGGAKKVLA